LHSYKGINRIVGEMSYLHLPVTTLAEYILDGVVNLGFDVTNII
jgi:hypothetical protein